MTPVTPWGLKSCVSLFSTDPEHGRRPELVQGRAPRCRGICAQKLHSSQASPVGVFCPPVLGFCGLPFAPHHPSSSLAQHMEPPMDTSLPCQESGTLAEPSGPRVDCEPRVGLGLLGTWHLLCQGQQVATSTAVL